MYRHSRHLGPTAVFALFVALSATLFAASVAGAGAPEEPAPTRSAVDLAASVFTTGDQEQAAVDAGPDGRMVAVWASRRQEAGGYGVYARAFDATGRAASPEVHVNRAVRGLQHRPAVAVDGDGAWVVWESSAGGGAIVARRFDRNLVPVGDEIPVAAGGAASPSVAVDRDGRALVVWSAAGEVRGRLLADGGPAGGERALGDGRDAYDDLPAVTSLPEGRFLAVWSRRGRSDEGGGVHGRVVAAGGTPDGPELRISPADPAGAVHVEPAVAADPSGRVAVAWLAGGRSVDGYAVSLRRGSLADRGGVDFGPLRTVADPGSGWKSGVAVAMAADGRLAVSYNSDGEDGDGEGVYARLFAADGTSLADAPVRVHRHAAGHQRATVASGARRSAWTAGDRLAFAWSGDAGLGDPSAAHLSLLLPAGVAPPAAPDPAVEVAAAATTSDELAIPPIWNPDFEPQAPLVPGGHAGGDFGFEAIPGTGWTPPDPEMAVGPDRVMAITNGAIAAFDKVGNLQWQDEIENNFGFWGELGTDNFVFDPEVTWDPHAQRFFAMANERSDDNRSNFLLAVSQDQTPDDRDDWHKYRLDVTTLAGDDIDSPNLAVGRDFVLLTADFFGPDAYLIYVVDKSSILEGGSPTTTSELIVGAGQQSMGIPVVYSDTATLYILQSTELSVNTTVILHAITDPFTDYDRQTFTLTVPTYTYPNQPPQLGSASRPFLFEPRFWSVAERSGTLWAVHHVDSSRARVRWYQIDLGDWPGSGVEPSILQSGELDLGDGIHTYFPSIHADDAGNAAITFARSATNEFISMGRAVRGAGDPPNTFRPPQVVQVSRNPHTSGRWGDYSGTQADPAVPGTFWGHHEFTDGTNSSWRTWMARYDLRPEPMLLTADPPAGDATVDLHVTGATPGATVHFYLGTEGTGLTEVPALEVVLSLENAVEVANAVADGNGDATTTVQLQLDEPTLLQAAEDNHTSDWIETLADGGPIFADGFESGDTTAWSATVP